MRLEKKRLSDLEKRKGLTGRTVIQAIWLLITAVAAYFLIEAFIAQELFTYQQLRRWLFISPTVPEWAVQAGAILAFVIVMQFFFIFGFAFFSNTGRIRPGRPSLTSRNPDPLDKEYRG